MIRVALLDGLTPATGAWLAGMNPAARRALMDGARLIRTQAVANIRSTFRRTGRNRTGQGMRGVKLKADQGAGVQTVRIWHSSGILAAHELGSTVPPATIRRRGGVLGRPYTRRGWTLRRRPTLEPAYRTQAAAILALFEREYQALVDQAPPALKA